MPRVARRTLNRGFTKPFSRVTRIHIGQNPERPIRLRRRNVIRPGSLRFSPWWWITHRRGLSGRPKVGEDPLERRAIPKDMIKGTLPERIVYRWLVDHYFVPDIDFDFQSSLQGGRLELGGVVVDYLFKQLRIALQIQGPTHNQYLRLRKDSEQRMMLELEGYTVMDLDMDIIYDEGRFEDEMRRIFGLGTFRFATQVSAGGIKGSLGPEGDSYLLRELIDRADAIYMQLTTIAGQL